MRCKAILFDLDGTLLDTLDDLADSMNQCLREEGFPAHPVDSYRYFVGDGMKNIVLRSAPPGTPEDVVERLVDRMNRHYGENWHSKTRPYPGVREMLAAAGREKLKLGVLSNKPDGFTQVVMRHYFDPSAFACVRGAREGFPRKPDPAGALEIAGALETAPSDFLYVGDTNTDMKTAKAAGMHALGATWGFRPVSEILAAGADELVWHPREILEKLEIPDMRRRMP